MKLQYLGTAAAEGIPGMFCNCEICENARKVKGKEIKTRSQALLDDTVLIDFPADTYMHILNNGIRLDEIHTLIITHSHSDHFYPKDLWCRADSIANNIEEKPLNVYVTKSGYTCANDFLKKEAISDRRVALHEIFPFVPFEAEGYRFIPLAADHSDIADSVIYIIEKDNKTLLYAHDTGYFKPEAWDFLSKYDRKFDLISLDCTGMLMDYRSGHMGLKADIEVYKRLLDMKLCDENTKVYLNHFSHNGEATHEQFSKIAAEHGFIVTFDGMTVEI